MTTDRDLQYQAQYQRRRRAAERAAGKSHLNVSLPGDLIGQLDMLKSARGLSNRNETLALVLREYFDRGDDERNQVVSA